MCEPGWLRHHLRELDLPLPEALREVSRRLFQSLTQDHSVSEEDRRITHYVGQGDLEPTVRRLRWTRLARLLLCSDGVNRTPEEACARLVEGARARGGRDNISVIVVDGP